MSRLVKHTATTPAKVTTPSGDDVFVCRCGLTKNEKGMCDGSHKKTQDEDKGKVYCYDQDLKREEVDEKVEGCGGCSH